MTSTGTHLTELSAGELLAGYAADTFRPVDVLAAVQTRIAEQESQLNAFALQEPVAATHAAAASAARWAAGEPVGDLDGVPITLKENIATAGAPITAGTAALADAEPRTVDGLVALTTAAAGAVRLGKTTMPDYGMLSSGLSSLHGITRNPWNHGWSPGGSSAGAAAAAAAGFGPLHVGSDIGGSIRLPAGWTGLASLKPTHGLVPVDPPYLGRVVGPLARTVADLAVAMRVLVHPDPLDRDHTYIPLPVGDWTQVSANPMHDGELAGLRVAVHTDAGAGLRTDDEVARIVADAAAVFARAGAQVVALPPFVTHELLGQLEMFLRARSWLDVLALTQRRRDAVLPYIRRWAIRAADLSGTQVFEAYTAVQELRARTATATGPYDVVLSPVAPVATFPAEQHGPTDDPDTAFHHVAYTAPYNVSDQPAATVNAGFTADGRPVGLQLAGRRFTDVALLRVAGWFEGARSESARPVWPS